LGIGLACAIIAIPLFPLRVVIKPRFRSWGIVLVLVLVVLDLLGFCHERRA
jgi:hypothetical protein